MSMARSATDRFNFLPLRLPISALSSTLAAPRWLLIHSTVSTWAAFEVLLGDEQARRHESVVGPLGAFVDEHVRAGFDDEARDPWLGLVAGVEAPLAELIESL